MNLEIGNIYYVLATGFVHGAIFGCLVVVCNTLWNSLELRDPDMVSIKKKLRDIENYVVVSWVFVILLYLFLWSTVGTFWMMASSLLILAICIVLLHYRYIFKTFIFERLKDDGN